MHLQLKWKDGWNANGMARKLYCNEERSKGWLLADDWVRLKRWSAAAIDTSARHLIDEGGVDAHMGDIPKEEEGRQTDHFFSICFCFKRRSTHLFHSWFSCRPPRFVSTRRSTGTAIFNFMSNLVMAETIEFRCSFVSHSGQYNNCCWLADFIRVVWNDENGCTHLQFFAFLFYYCPTIIFCLLLCTVNWMDVCVLCCAFVVCWHGQQAMDPLVAVQ